MAPSSQGKEPPQNTGRFSSTHAEYPSSHANDNVLSQNLQGHTGTIAECTACHTTVPLTYVDGPHGLHSVGSIWVTNHRSYANSAAKRATCTACHGTDYRGGVLSKTSAARNFGNNRVTPLARK